MLKGTHQRKSFEYKLKDGLENRLKNFIIKKDKSVKKEKLKVYTWIDLNMK